jgi:hypothetical protein
MELTSILVNRRAHRAKTARLHVQGLLRVLFAYRRGATSAPSSGYRALRRKTPNVNTVSANI